MPTRIGCDNLVYALMTTEESPTVAAVYGTPVPLPGVMSIGINPNSSSETLFADDGPMESATTLGKIDVEIKKNELTITERAAILGHALDSKKALVYGSADVPPWIAIGFRTLKSNGKYRYVWLYKGKFQDMEEQNETKGDGINFQADTIKGQFVKLGFPYRVGGENRAPWKYEIDADTPSVDAATITAWFTQVTMPTADPA